jgi:formylglycine-generating enzyme required for sulfatase activity
LSHFLRRTGVHFGGKCSTASRAPALILAGVIGSLAWAPLALSAGPERGKLEGKLAQIKAKSAAVAAGSLARLNALPPQQRLAAPPAIWRVPGVGLEFQDCADCPRMVVIPAGDFTMGSPPAELNAETQHRVTIAKPLAVSKFAITFDQWDACVRNKGCDDYRPEDQGWGRGHRPAINISWENAKSYVEWLARKTGKPYRLLTESEWEYAARAGTVTRYSTGETISPRLANYDGSGDGSGPSDTNRQKTMPVGSFPPNSFGLYDMQGNVAQWVEDCWHSDYTAASPTDGSAWIERECEGRVMRGGSWEDSQTELRSAARLGEYRDNSSYVDGFRVARDF